MDRHHKWIAAVAALTSSAWLAVAVIGGPPPSTNAPVIQLMAPEFDDIDDVEAAKSPAAPRGRASISVNRPLGLGFPGQGNPTKADPGQRRASRSDIQPVQGVESSSPEESDPPPPRGISKPAPGNHRSATAEELTPEEIRDSGPQTKMSPQQSRGVPISMRDTQSDLAGVAALSPPYVPANQDPDALPWTAPFEERVARAPEHEEIDTRADDLTELPSDYVPWWIGQLPTLIKADKTAVPVDVDSLVTGALQYSPQILGIRTQPEIANSVLATENAAFDWTSFVESRWDDLNDPVGNTLTTGNNSTRFIDQIAVNTAGLKRRNESGGQIDISQKLGWQDNNSTFFVPRPQGTARLMVNYTQPLLNGAGVAYNQSRIVLAQIELNRSFDVVQEELQEHLIRVTEAYWDLYRSRVVFLQRQRVYDRAEYILETLGGRADIDALQRQVNRAKAAVASRRSEIVRSQTAIRNAESRLRLLVNDPQFLDLSSSELVPIEAPHADHVPLSLTGSLQEALQHRPDISQAVHDLRAAGVRLGVSQNELLPKLDLVLTTYVAGLQGDSDISQAWVDQFTTARPGYTVGTLYEMPLGNRAAKARLNRRQWELTRSVYDFRTVVETGLTEVELAIRETETSYREMIAKFQSLVAAETESSYLEDRWKVLPGGDRGTTLLLEDLLDSQQRETDAEVEFVNAQVAYSVSLIRVRRAMGTLLISQNPERYPDGSSPSPAPVSPEQIEPAPESESPTPTEVEPISAAEPESRKKFFRPFSAMTRKASGSSRPATKSASQSKSSSGKSSEKAPHH